MPLVLPLADDPAVLTHLCILLKFPLCSSAAVLILQWGQFCTAAAERQRFVCAAGECISQPSILGQVAGAELVDMFVTLE